MRLTANDISTSFARLDDKGALEKVSRDGEVGASLRTTVNEAFGKGLNPEGSLGLNTDRGRGVALWSAVSGALHDQKADVTETFVKLIRDYGLLADATKSEIEEERFAADLSAAVKVGDSAALGDLIESAPDSFHSEDLNELLTDALQDLLSAVQDDAHPDSLVSTSFTNELAAANLVKVVRTLLASGAELGDRKQWWDGRNEDLVSVGGGGTFAHIDNGPALAEAFIKLTNGEAPDSVKLPGES